MADDAPPSALKRIQNIEDRIKALEKINRQYFRAINDLLDGFKMHDRVIKANMKREGWET